MFASLKSLLSNHVSPGGALVTLSPFSCLFARVTVTTSSPETPDITSDLEDALGYLDADELVRGRVKLAEVLEQVRQAE